jgi:hypothetical protein
MALAEADMGITTQAMGQAEEKAMVQFFMQPKKNGPKSKAAGRPIFEDREYIKIMTPGNKDNIPVSPVTDIHRKRFAPQYKRWLESRDSDQAVEGTPLSEWPGVSRTQVEELRYFNVHTVEQLVELSDANSQGFMGINALKTRAKAYLDAADKQSIVDERTRLLEENEEMKGQIAEMQAAIRALKDDGPAKRRTTSKTAKAATEE